jgi:hypothetical protein
MFAAFYAIKIIMVITLKQIAERKGVTYRAVKKRRDKEGWRPTASLRVNHKTAEAFHVNTLPLDIQRLLSDENGEFLESNALTDNELEMVFYSSAPAWARKKADKYLCVLRATEGLKGRALREFISEWNHKYPELRTSYPRVVTARRIYRQEGISCLLAQYGKSAGRTIVKDAWFTYFKAAYLLEGAPSLRSCWLRTLGYAKHCSPDITIGEFPSSKSFLRRLEREVPKSAVYLARHGREAWNSKFNNYIDRDYTHIRPGECFVSDHAQVDVAVMLPGGKACFPWLTAWRDFKSGKWLGWLHHPEPPNSDHVFQSFYHAVKECGIPGDVYIDNGKDYRARDFAGGRRFHRVNVDEYRAISVLGLLGISPHFSLPYNAQSKSIERDFLKNKEWFSKHVPGYRGGHVKERPEKLKSEIRTGKILTWNEYIVLMDIFVTDVLNKMPSNGKVLRGMSPDELWDREHTEARMVSPDALKLFCMRTSRPLTIGRNGVRDSETEVSYWGEWMSGMKGQKVYLRRDIKSYQEAWVFRAGDDEYLGKAYMAERAAALARTDLEKAQLRKLLAQKKQSEKITKAFIRVKEAPSPAEAISHLKAGVETLNGNRQRSSIGQGTGFTGPHGATERVVRRQNTKMDVVIKKENEMRKEGTCDINAIQPPVRAKRKIYIFESDKPGNGQR